MSQNCQAFLGLGAELWSVQLTPGLRIIEPSGMWLLGFLACMRWDSGGGAAELSARAHLGQLLLPTLLGRRGQEGILDVIGKVTSNARRQSM